MSSFPFMHFKNVSLSVIVPVYNEGPDFQENLQVLVKEIGKYFKEFEIIVVNDGSTDVTNINNLENINSHVKIISLPTNQGKGAAVRKGFTESSGDFVLFIDGGMEIHPEEIKILLGLMYLYEADIVVGSKRHPQSKVNYPFYRRLLSLAFQTIVRILFHINVTDTQVGIKLFRKEVVKTILPYLKINSYGFDIEILGVASFFGYRKIMEAPVRLEYFLKNKRSVVHDLIHTANIGVSLLKDTITLWWRLRSLSSKASK
jgi:dolichol-phosphate mannosyltransferase